MIDSKKEKKFAHVVVVLENLILVEKTPPELHLKFCPQFYWKHRKH